MLPKNENIIYDLTLPVSKIKIKYTPFRVKEKKIFLTIKESDGDREFLLNNIKNILQNCITNDVKIEDLPIVDIEFFFTQLRARSIGEVVQAKYICNVLVKKERTDIDDEIEVYEEQCGNIMSLDIKLLELGVNVKDYKDTIGLTNKIGIKFKYPDFEYIDKISDIDMNSDVLFDIIYNCVDYIYDENNLYYRNEIPKQELIDFFDSLSLKQFDMIENYFKNLPKLEKDFELKCSSCGHVHKIHIEGIENFFV